MRRNDLSLLMHLGAALALAACGGGDKGAAAPAAGKKIIVIQLVTDGAGNRFEPNKIEAEKGDLLRFTLKAGVHNVDFLPDSNPGKTGLPKASEMLQLPGQTVDIPVTFEKGKYYFQCDPHAALGMKGELEVEH